MGRTGVRLVVDDVPVFRVRKVKYGKAPYQVSIYNLHAVEIGVTVSPQKVVHMFQP